MSLFNKVKPMNEAMREAFPVPYSDPLAAWHILGDRPDHVCRKHYRSLRFTTIENIAKIVYFVLIFGSIGWLGSQIIDRGTPQDVKLELLTPAVKPGSDVKFKVMIHRYRNCDGQLFWTLYDGNSQIYTFGPVELPANGKLGDVEPYIRLVHIPSNLEPGTASVSFTRKYQCPGNYIQEIKPIESWSGRLPFVILNKDGSMPVLKDKLLEE